MHTESETLHKTEGSRARDTPRAASYITLYTIYMRCQEAIISVMEYCGYSWRPERQRRANYGGRRSAIANSIAELVRMLNGTCSPNCETLSLGAECEGMLG